MAEAKASGEVLKCEVCRNVLEVKDVGCVEVVFRNKPKSDDELR